MLLNGIALENTSPEELAEMLEVLPSAFRKRGLWHTQFTYRDNDAGIEMQKGMRFYNQWNENKDENGPALLSARDHFNRAAQKSAAKFDIAAEAYDLSNYGKTLLLSGDNKSAIEALEKSITNNKKLGFLDAVYRDIGDLHDAIQHEMERLKDDADAVSLLAQKARACRADAAATQQYHIGMTKINQKAHRIEQNEVGFSAKDPIGTDNVNDCVCVIVRDRVTKKTALAHVDAGTNIFSLNEIIERMPANAVLEARLIGARHGRNTGHERSMKRSIDNLEKVAKTLAKANVNILSADILENDQPTAIVVDPASFEIREETPDREYPHFTVNNGMSIIGYAGKDLQVAFDLTHSDERAPYVLNETYGKFLKKNFVGRSEKDIYQYLRHELGYPSSQCASIMNEVIKLADEFERTYSVLKTEIDAMIDNLKKDGISFSDAEFNVAHEVLPGVPMYLGANADRWNSDIVSLMESEYRRIYKEERPLQFNEVSQVVHHAMKGQSYNKIISAKEKEVRIRKQAPVNAFIRERMS